MNRIKPLWVPSNSVGMPGPMPFSDPPDSGLPKPKLSAAIVKNRLAKAGIDKSQHDRIVALLVTATGAYMVQKIIDEQSATPKQVQDYRRRVEKAAGDFLAVLEPDRDPATLAIDPASRAIIHALKISPTLLSDLKTGAAQLIEAANAVAAKAGAPHKGGGRETKRVRQVRFAKGFLDTFEANGWPMETSRNGLMAQLLAECLKAAGDATARPDRLLKDAGAA